ncbi:carbohydrate binding domain-containing protein [Catenovulum sediminis]|uniref:Carbohydrate binding domain-containing protein n=1 Tax=Catenovulum sediminis TaxID=1740262 RepID=A0ABV1RN36_9ALTE
MQTYKLKYSALAIAGLLAFQAQANNSTEIKIYPKNKLFIGDVSDLQRNKFFNIHSSPNDPAMQDIERDYILNELNASFGRSFSSPFNKNMGSNYPDTQSVMQSGAQNLQNYAKFPFAGYDVSRQVMTEHPYNMIVEGNDPVAGARFVADYFQYNFDDTNRPGFYEPMNEPFVHAHEFVDGPWDNSNNEAMQRHMAKWFAEIGREFDAREIPVQVVGFSSAWPSLELNNFNHWETRMRMFMDTAGEVMDGIAFHLYDGVNVTGQDNLRSGSNAEAIMDLQETYSQLSFNKVIPHAVTEYGGIVKGFPDEYSAAKSSQELRSYNHLLFSLLAREDRLLTSIPFITGTAQWYYQANNFNPYSATIYRPDPDKIKNGKVNGFLETEKAKFYKLWADVKGYRIDFSEQDPDLATQVFAYGNKLYVCLNNFDSASKAVNLNFMQNLGATAVRIKRLDVPYGEAANYSDQTQVTIPTSFTLNPDETLIAEYQLAQPLDIQHQIHRNTYYADTHLLPISANQTLRFNFNHVEVAYDNRKLTHWVASQMNIADLPADKPHPNPDKLYPNLIKKYQKKLDKLKDASAHSKESQKLMSQLLHQPHMNNALKYQVANTGFSQPGYEAVLRMSISRKHDKNKQPYVSINGFALSVPNNWAGHDQANRDDFFGAIEIPVPSEYLTTDNQVDIRFDDDQGFISSVILEVESQKAHQVTLTEHIKLSQNDIVLNKNDVKRIRAQVLPATASNKSLVWSTSDSTIATVDDSGLITAVAPGYVQIGVQSVDGATQTQINVEIRDQLTTRNTVTFTQAISQLPETDTINVEIEYQNDKTRDLVLALYDSQNRFVKDSRTALPAGQGVQNIQLTLDSALMGGEQVRLLASLRATGGDWRTTIDSHDIKNITVIADEQPDTDPSQLLAALNADFEMGDLTHWQHTWDSTGDVFVSADSTQTSNYSAQIDTSNGKVGLLIGDNLPMQAGKKYKVSFSVQKTAGSGWGGGFVQLVNNENGWVGSPQGPWFGTSSNGDWIHFEKEIDGADWPQNGTQLQIVFGTAHHAWELDNVKLQDITPDSNLLAPVNADFENAELSPWIAYWENDASSQLLITDGAATTGNYVLNILSDGTKNTGLTLPPEVTPQQMGLNDNAQYQISFNVRSLNGNVSGWFRSVAQGAWANRIESWFDAGHEWKEVSFIRDAVDWTANQNNARIDLYFNANSSTHINGINVEIDNVRIEKIEP